MSFSKLNPNHKLFKFLSESPPRWWRNLLKDKDVWADVRKDNYIDVYYKGGRIINLKYTSTLKAILDSEYLPTKKDSSVNYIFTDNKNRFGDISLPHSVDVVDLDNFSTPALKRIKSRISVHNPSGSEKELQGQFVTDSKSSFIDTELAYTKTEDTEKGGRIDLIWANQSEKKICFVELKSINNAELYNRGSKGIRDQLVKYSKFIKKHHVKILEYYKTLIEIKRRIGALPQGFDPKNIDDYTLEEKPVLLVGVTGKAQQNWIDTNSEYIDSLVSEVAGAAIYTGGSTFSIPRKTDRNKHIFG